MCNRLLQRLRLNEWGPQAEGPFLLNVHDIGTVFPPEIDTTAPYFLSLIINHRLEHTELVCEQWRGYCPVTGVYCFPFTQYICI